MVNCALCNLQAAPGCENPDGPCAEIMDVSAATTRCEDKGRCVAAEVYAVLATRIRRWIHVIVFLAMCVAIHFSEFLVISARTSD
jgi:hypothetical protein